MSFLDRVAAAVAPAASDEDRLRARQHAEALGRNEPWLATIIAQHRMIEDRFAECAAAAPADRPQALRQLEAILTGHAMAEEATLYPDVAEKAGKTKAAMAYEEQAVTKVQLAKLEKIDPASKEWDEKLEHIRSAVQQHMYQEESSWFPDLVDELPETERRRMGSRFAEEYGNYAQGAGIDNNGRLATKPAMPPVT